MIASIVGILVTLFLVFFNDLIIRHIDKYIFQNQEFNAIKSYSIWLLVIGILIILYASSQRNIIVNQTSEENTTVWNVNIFNGTDNLIRATPTAIWSGEISGNKNGLEYDMGFNAPQFFHSNYFPLSYILNHDLPKDNFSIEFKIYQYFENLVYCFSIEYIDDGANLLIDEEPLIERWWGYQIGGLYREPKLMNEGYHQITLHYYDANANSKLQLQWYPQPGRECTSSGDPGYIQKYQIP